MDILLVDGTGETRAVLQARDDELVLAGGHVVHVDAIPAWWLRRGALPNAEGICPVVHGRPVVRTRADAALLLLVAGQWPELIDLDGDASYHVVLSFAFPLWLDIGWRRWTLDSLDVVVAGDQLVVVPASDLVAVDPLVVAEAALMCRHSRLLRSHRNTSVRFMSEIGPVLTWWEEFSEQRHGRRPTSAESTALRRVALMAGCEAKEYRVAGSPAVMSLVCRHGPTRTLFDLLAPWDATWAALRPGVYSAVDNLLEAHRQEFRYCLCYGNFGYKDEVVGALPRLGLEHLAPTRSEHDHVV